MIFSVVYLFVRRLLGCLVVLARREVVKDAELLVLRHQNAGAAPPDRPGPLPADRPDVACGTVPADPGQLPTSVKFLIRDRAGQFTGCFDAVFTAAGIRIPASPPQAPRANAICEPMIGTLRREVFDRLLIINDHHLRRVLTEYPTALKPDQRMPHALTRPCDALLAVEGEAGLAHQDDEALLLARVDVLGNHAAREAALVEADERSAGVLSDGGVFDPLAGSGVEEGPEARHETRQPE